VRLRGERSGVHPGRSQCWCSIEHQPLTSPECKCRRRLNHNLFLYGRSLYHPRTMPLFTLIAAAVLLQWVPRPLAHLAAMCARGLALGQRRIRCAPPHCSRRKSGHLFGFRLHGHRRYSVLARGSPEFQRVQKCERKSDYVTNFTILTTRKTAFSLETNVLMAFK
jgi:hypothetical protein